MVDSRDGSLRNYTRTTVHTVTGSLRKSRLVTLCWMSWGRKALDHSAESHLATWSQNQFVTHGTNRDDEILFC